MATPQNTSAEEGRYRQAEFWSLDIDAGRSYGANAADTRFRLSFRFRRIRLLSAFTFGVERAMMLPPRTLDFR